ncbi:hypothetical protein PAXRUDRAFT_24976 [Paxillus rubicundulus Ve08.2h10]|uniref:Unplaced genomic scaffold scaffold_152, whole genome shotgun sequence n=1 Tax=Paxillus rubicundulus Ve08.2h10 TaxID=930991 RepID=A0A0D0EAK3_9AGAM|nr:hypothetical protein PAXRUDRAFT_24976 [Paxillus rubicundulus Ve08.2h10]
MSQELTFTTASLFNATISSVSDAIYFDIQTPEWEPHLMTVRRLDPRAGTYELTACVRNQADKQVAVSMYGGEFEPEEQWVKKVGATIPGMGSRGQFDDGEGNMFTWSVGNGNLELCSTNEGVKTKRAIATFYQHKQYFMVGMISQHTCLEIDNPVTESPDTIILSLLTIERKRRAGKLACFAFYP